LTTTHERCDVHCTSGGSRHAPPSPTQVIAHTLATHCSAASTSAERARMVYAAADSNSRASVQRSCRSCRLLSSWRASTRRHSRWCGAASAKASPRSCDPPRCAARVCRCAVGVPASSARLCPSRCVRVRAWRQGVLIPKLGTFSLDGARAPVFVAAAEFKQAGQALAHRTCAVALPALPWRSPTRRDVARAKAHQCACGVVRRRSPERRHVGCVSVSVSVQRP
jgi:hypothetical protein